MSCNLNVLDNTEGSYGKSGFTPSGCDPSARCGNGLEKKLPTCAVRYGYMRYIGEFKYSPGVIFNCGGKVVIQTNRGMEIGEQISLTCSGCDKSIDRKKMVEYAKRSGSEFMQLRSGRILRAATDQDLDEERHLNLDAASKLAHARQVAASLQLDMKFIVCEHLLGGERIIFHFMSGGRVDFRDLVKQLAQEYHTRIEMHQVGARDEARLVADYEICGLECCCRTFLKKLRQVNMKMAKLQKATLDPTKVSGRCGRLRCCLRYEHEGYEELNKKLPRNGSRIRTERGIGTIRDRQILTQLLAVQYDDSSEREIVALEQVLETGLPKQPPAPPPALDQTKREERPKRDRRDDRKTREESKTEDQQRVEGREEPAQQEGETRRRKRRRGRRRGQRQQEGDGAPAEDQRGESVESPPTPSHPKPPQTEQKAEGEAEKDPRHRRRRRRRGQGRRGRRPGGGADGEGPKPDSSPGQGPDSSG